MKKLICAVGWAFLLLPAGCKRQGPEPAAAPQPQKIYLFFTNDLEGEIDLCGCPSRRMGGISRRAKYIERFAQMQEPVLQVDAGDGFLPERGIPAPVSASEKEFALVLARAAARLKVDAVNVGALDLLGGVDFLQQLQEKAQEYGKLNLISSNLAASAGLKPLFETDKVVERNRVKFGIFGLSRSRPLVSESILMQDPKAAAAAKARQLREEKKVDLVVGLFNLGLEESKKICEQVPGIDIVVVSSLAQYLTRPELAGNCLLVQAGPGGKYLGQLEIMYQRGRKRGAGNPAEAKKLQDEIARLNTELDQLRGRMHDQPGLQEKYLALTSQRDKLRSDLEKMSLGFDYNYLLVPLDLTLPVDVKIQGWVMDALKAREKQE